MDDQISHWLSRPVSSVLQHVASVVKFHSDVEFIQDSFNILLTCMCANCDNSTASVDIHRSVAQLLRQYSVIHPNICLLLLQHLPAIPHPELFLDILPSILIIASPSAVNEAFDSLLSLVIMNYSLIIPVLNVLLEFQLTPERKREIVNVTVNSLSSIVESDFPGLFKLIFANLNIYAGTEVIRKIRLEVHLLHQILCMRFVIVF